VLQPVLVVMCDIRRGRDRRFASGSHARSRQSVRPRLGIAERQVVVEFTQHTPDEMFRYGNMAPEWSPAEAVPGALQ